jgi:hypothetical protein
MKGNRLIAILISTVLILQVCTAIAQSDVINSIKETIKAGSAKELSRYLNQTIDITLEGKVESYSKSQAEFFFRDFFKQHPLAEVLIIHQGSSKGGQQYAIFQYKTNSDTFRLFMKIKMGGKDGLLVYDIRFTKE